MPVEHLPASTTPDRVAALLERDGCVVVDRLASAERVATLVAELQPFIDATSPGVDSFSGRNTRRTGALIARSPNARDFVMDPTVLGTVQQMLSHSKNYQLHLTQVISIGPGEPAQMIHRDQWAYDFFPFPRGYEVQCNTLWALTDFNERTGATRVVPGSHRFEDRLKFKHEETEPAEMEAGSVLFYSGALYHGGGANCSDEVRMGLNITYNLAWLRQEENQYLATPPEIARELPEPLLRLMGYAKGAYALGYVGDLLDPIAAVRPELAKKPKLGELEDTRKGLNIPGEADPAHS